MCGHRKRCRRGAPTLFGQTRRVFIARGTSTGVEGLLTCAESMTSTTRAERVRDALAQVGVGNVLLHHALGIEKRSVDGNGVLHDGKVAAAILVEEWKNHVFEFRIQAFGV